MDADEQDSDSLCLLLRLGGSCTSCRLLGWMANVGRHKVGKHFGDPPEAVG
jgi:hypothetical protein